MLIKCMFLVPNYLPCPKGLHLIRLSPDLSPHRLVPTSFGAILYSCFSSNYPRWLWDSTLLAAFFWNVSYMAGSFSVLFQVPSQMSIAQSPFADFSGWYCLPVCIVVTFYHTAHFCIEFINTEKVISLFISPSLVYKILESYSFSFLICYGNSASLTTSGI